MKANWIAGGLLLVLYLLWLTATAPARLLVPMLPPAVQVGQFSGSVWRGAAQQVYWHGERLERLAWSLTLAGWQVSLSDPRGVMGQARLWGLRDLRLQEGRLTAPASMLSRWLMSTMPVKAAGEVTFSLTEGRFSDGRCRQIIAGGAQWRQARLHSPVGSLALAPTGAEFLGSDAAAGELTGDVPWLEPLFRPGSAELESGLFALQAGLGGILLGFVLGRLTARRRS